MIGDNIYHKKENGEWIQEDSHHSNADGSIHQINLVRDTKTSENVLISRCFFYFGEKAIPVDLASIQYVSGLGFKKISLSESEGGRELIETVYLDYRKDINLLIADPCQFMNSHQRVDQRTGKIA